MNLLVQSVILQLVWPRSPSRRQSNTLQDNGWCDNRGCDHGAFFSSQQETIPTTGNFSNLSNVQSIDHYIYTPATETTVSPQHGVKVAPVIMYETKAGTDFLSAQVPGRASKNQVNYIMAAAAKLNSPSCSSKLPIHPCHTRQMRRETMDSERDNKLLGMYIRAREINGCLKTMGSG